MEDRFCPNCGESCEKEHETLFENGQEFCVCCNSNIDPSSQIDRFNDYSPEEEGEINNVFMDFFNKSGYLEYHD